MQVRNGNPKQDKSQVKTPQHINQVQDQTQEQVLKAKNQQITHKEIIGMATDLSIETLRNRKTEFK